MSRGTESRAPVRAGHADWVALLLAAGLCVVGAVLGADRVRAVTRSGAGPWLWTVPALWALWRAARALARRDERLHLLARLGVVLVLAGVAAGSPAADRTLGREGPPCAWIVLTPESGTDILRDRTLMHRVGTLPTPLTIEEERTLPVPTCRVSGKAPDGTPCSGATAVNRPLRAGTWWLYLVQPGTPQGRPTVLMLARARGLGCVWAGYAFILLGTVAACWLAPLGRPRPEEGRDAD